MTDQFLQASMDDMIACQTCELNVRTWLRYQGIEPNLKFTKVCRDRVFLDRNHEFEEEIIRLCLHDYKMDMCYCGSHGKTALIGYRESVGRCAAQIVVHADCIEIDFDYWRPWDVVGLIGHGWEVLTNKISKSKTNPFKIQEELKKRGVYGS